MNLKSLLDALGYRQSPFYRESGDTADLPMAHLLRDAQRAQVSGTYFIRTMGGVEGARRDRPAVHVAEATTPEGARAIHRHLWNQGTTPFLLVFLPGQVRVYTPFAYDQSNERVGQVEQPIDTGLGLRDVAERLSFLRADSIDSGDLWRKKGSYLTNETRVDRTLIRTLRSLSAQLVTQHHLNRDVAHALLGRFVYLYYLRERDILSDQWLDAVDVNPENVFSSNVRLNAFRRVTDAVDERFNGRIFPINWSASSAPGAEAVRAAGRAFTGEVIGSGQIPLFPPFDFSFIPVELLSAIYEQFLHDEGRGAEEGAFYTSEPVADYLLAEVNSVRPLDPSMKVLDPCCGSGIFLVLAFRRLVEQELRRRRTNRLSPTELRQILTRNIFGVERNPEACLVTEFSLILTLLSYIDPPELHRHPNFRFPELHNEQIFEADFFSDTSVFWQSNQRYDWIVGNPPWIEVDPENEDEQPLVSWIQENPDTPVARFRSGEAFTWRVKERLADAGAVGLVTQATSLTNDQSAGYRKAFFARNTVRRVTNFSNLAYILFESADEPAANLIYSDTSPDTPNPEIIHFGPMVVSQPAMAPYQSQHKAPWVLTVGESEIQVIPVADAARGEATTWKRALWGNPRDHRAMKRLRQIFPTTLGDISEKRGWFLNLGLQLRPDRGSENHPNQDIATVKREQGATEVEARNFAQWFAGLKVAEPKGLRTTSCRLVFPEHWLVKNRWGTFLREGRHAGLRIIRAPHLFLWNDFAAFSGKDYILRHPKVGLSAPGDEDWLKAVSLIWASAITPYCLFLDLSAGWGISRSTIDLGDVRRMPMPEFDPERVSKLNSLYAELAAEESLPEEGQEWQRRVDDGVASILSIPEQIMLLAREFKEFRLPLVKGKAPRELTRPPDKKQLQKYASRLKKELDSFIERKERRHAITLLSSPAGLVATVELTEARQVATALVRDADESEQSYVRDILSAAEEQYGQWVYVKRSVRVFSGRKIHLCKPPRRLEWTETQALLDAADVIAEVAESRGRK